MTLRGVGIDVSSVTRMGALLDRYGDRFVRRWFGADQAAAAGGTELATQLASCFAVKEAAWKALGLDSRRPVPWREMVIIPDGAAGSWSIRLEGELGREAVAQGVGRVTATASRDGDLVVAIALAEVAVVL